MRNDANILLVDKNAVDVLLRAAEDITVFDMTGLALQDLTVARLIFQKASAAGAGTSVAWPW